MAPATQHTEMMTAKTQIDLGGDADNGYAKGRRHLEAPHS